MELTTKAESILSEFKGLRLLLWQLIFVDPSDGDIVNLRQSGNQVIGFYNLGRRDLKLGVYRGCIYNRVFGYHWNWIDGTYEGYG